MAAASSKPDPDKTDKIDKIDKAAETGEGAEPVRSVSVDTAEAHTDRVAMVSRTKDGNPDQSADYEVLHPDGATDADKRRAENRPADNQIDTGGS